MSFSSAALGMMRATKAMKVEAAMEVKVKAVMKVMEVKASIATIISAAVIAARKAAEVFAYATTTPKHFRIGLLQMLSDLPLLGRQMLRILL